MQKADRILLAAVLLGAFAAGLSGCGGSADEEPAPVEPPPPAEPAPEPPPPPPEPVRTPPSPPATGRLEVNGTPGAVVFWDGERLGEAPGAWDDLDAGEYSVRVEKDGFHPLEVTITIRGGRTRSLSAELTEKLGSIVVESDIPGAMVFLDRTFEGNTPVTIEELRPGSYTLTVSAEGHEVHTRRVEVERSPVPVRVELGESATTAAVEVQVTVVHKHRFGSCDGELAATGDGFHYRTGHKDAFELPFARVEAFELDYVRNNLRLKVRGGRTYNFESPTEDLDSLFVFHRDVTALKESQ